MIRALVSRRKNASSDLIDSKLYSERTFYAAFENDLLKSKSEVIIESPFITGNRVASLLPIFTKMRSRNIAVTINTRHPAEHDTPFDVQAWSVIKELQYLGINVLFTGGHHRKLAILDKKVLWEGSLNILSQNQSCEIMRRIVSPTMAGQMIQFIRLDKFLG